LRGTKQSPASNLNKVQNLVKVLNLDMVLYNRLLQCYVLIDLKTNKLMHKDLGQMQMYVNYYDRNIRQPFENPTIGIKEWIDDYDNETTQQQLKGERK
jgi:hypothetical protein